MHPNERSRVSHLDEVLAKLDRQITLDMSEFSSPPLDASLIFRSATVAWQKEVDLQVRLSNPALMPVTEVVVVFSNDTSFSFPIKSPEKMTILEGVLSASSPGLIIVIFPF